MSGKDPDELVVVGQIAGAFGVKGEVRVRSFTEDPESCLAYGPLLNEAGEVILTPVSHRPLKDVFGVTAKEPLEREGWEALKGTNLHVRRSALPAPDEDEFYIIDMIGCDVVHTDGRALGTLKNVPDFGAGSLLEVKPVSGPSFYLPFDADNTPGVDLSARRITVAVEDELLPDALQRQASDGGTN